MFLVHFKNQENYSRGFRLLKSKNRKSWKCWIVWTEVIKWSYAAIKWISTHSKCDPNVMCEENIYWQLYATHFSLSIELGKKAWLCALSIYKNKLSIYIHMEWELWCNTQLGVSLTRLHGLESKTCQNRRPKHYYIIWNCGHNFAHGCIYHCNLKSVESIMLLMCS